MRLKSNRRQSELILEDLYEMLQLTRQGVFQKIRSYMHEVEMMSQIKPQIRSYRSLHDRRAGSRSIFYNLQIKDQFDIGVTKFERLMSSHQMTIVPMRLRVITTHSDMQSWNYDNLVDGLAVNAINKVVAGDLTYVYIGTKLFYLFCLTDLCSAYLVGIAASDRMRSMDAQLALQEWIDCRGREAIQNCIHHTDGGKQYFSKKYVTTLKDHNIQISVARNCLQNGYAEQRNALLKHHLIPCKKVSDLQQFRKAMQEIKYFYNYERKQEELGWRTPAEYEKYLESGPAEPQLDKVLFRGKQVKKVLKA